MGRVVLRLTPLTGVRQASIEIPLNIYETLLVRASLLKTKLQHLRSMVCITKWEICELYLPLTYSLEMRGTKQ